MLKVQITLGFPLSSASLGWAGSRIFGEECLAGNAQIEQAEGKRKAPHDGGRRKPHTEAVVGGSPFGAIALEVANLPRVACRSRKCKACAPGSALMPVVRKESRPSSVNGILMQRLPSRVQPERLGFRSPGPALVRVAGSG
jgi:hypothetical protein